MIGRGGARPAIDGHAGMVSHGSEAELAQASKYRSTYQRSDGAGSQGHADKNRQNSGDSFVKRNTSAANTVMVDNDVIAHRQRVVSNHRSHISDLNYNDKVAGSSVFETYGGTKGTPTMLDPPDHLMPGSQVKPLKPVAQNADQQPRITILKPKMKIR